MKRFFSCTVLVSFISLMLVGCSLKDTNDIINHVSEIEKILNDETIPIDNKVDNGEYYDSVYVDLYDYDIEQAEITLEWITLDFDIDLDMSAFALDYMYTIPSNDYFIFYNNKVSPDGAITYDTDVKSSCDGAERLTFDFNKLDDKYIDQIILTLTVNNDDAKLSSVDVIKMTIYDTLNKKDIAYMLIEPYDLESAILGCFYKTENGTWRYRNTKYGSSCKLTDYCTQYGADYIKN